MIWFYFVSGVGTDLASILTKPPFKENSMCTKPRIIVPQVFYEITSKGVHGVNIFPGDDFKSFFLNELALTLKKFSFQCFAWSIMDDHYHLVVKSSENSISSFMQRLNSNYARYFNKKTKRNGVVFYRRFASAVIEEKTSLSETIRYVHLNPVRCGLCTLDEIDNFQWSGHHAILNRDTDGILDIANILKQFDGPDSMRIYSGFVKSGKEEGKTIEKLRSAHKGGQYFEDPGCWIIGGEPFTQNIINKDRCRRLRLARHITENVTVSDLLQKIKSCIYNSDISFQGRLNEVSTARQMFAVIGHCHFEFTCQYLARFLRVSGSAISSMISRSHRIMGIDYLSEMIRAA